MKLIYIVMGLLLVASCKQKEEPPKELEWAFVKTIEVVGVNPIGITVVKGKLWLSDGDHNRLVEIDKEGNITKTIDSLERPMHIDANKDTLYVPQYGNDRVTAFYLHANKTVKSGFKSSDIGIRENDSLDAPAGVSILKDEIAIADFYTNRILYFNGTDWISFGKEGKAKGYFYYPTDVQITTDKIWVADAYNNRVQVFDKTGKFLQMMGQDQKMNAATGIFVADEEVFVTDFENNRVLVFDKEGNLKQKLYKNIQKATDLIIHEGQLKIINYRNGKINIFEQVKKQVDKENLNK